MVPQQEVKTVTANVCLINNDRHTSIRVSSPSDKVINDKIIHQMDDRIHA